MNCRNIVRLARAAGFCAVAMGTINARAALARPPEYAAPSHATIHVDCAAASQGDGSAERPYWRITDALESARELRHESPRRIVIRVASGVCSGNFETQPIGQRTRPPELLPLVLNVPNLTLHGAGIMEYAEGFPVAQRPGTATTLTVDTFRYGWDDNTVILVGPTTDGGRADGTVIEGLAIDDLFNSVHGIWASRTQHLAIRNNVVEHVNFAAMNISECSGSVVGNVMHDGFPGLAIAGGSQENPSKLYVGGNNITANYTGIHVFGNSTVTVHFEVVANPLEFLPYPINPTASQVGNHMDVELAGNDVSNNYFGMRFSIIGVGQYPYSQTGSINASVHDNRFMDNGGYPFSIESGFVFRGTSSFWTNPDPFDFPEGFVGSLAAPFITHGPIYGPYTGVVNARFERNLWSNENIAPIAPAFLSFSHTYAYDPVAGAPDPSQIPHYVYMRNSRMNLDDDDGLFSLPGVIREDLRLIDPYDGTVLHNRTRITR